jgi:DNA polymerase-4
VAERIVLHADMDAFYASIEERDQPDLQGKPIIVGAVSKRGVVAAASYAARAYGVRSAMPGFRARELCPHGVYLPADIAKYARVSAQVHAIFQEFTPEIEPIALDEAFLDITASAHLHGGPIQLGQRLRERVREETRLPVSCGIASSKLVAKIACSLSKPDGLRYVALDETRQLLDPLPVRRLWGVGPVAERALVEAGYHSLRDVAEADLSRLREVAGDRAAALVQLARGIDDRPVVADREAKSYGEENTFERDIHELDVVSAALTSHAHAVARRMRHDRIRGRTITIKIKLARARGERESRVDPHALERKYPLLTRSKTLIEPTDDAAVIRETALHLWHASKLDVEIRLLGVSVSNLTSEQPQQLTLFDHDRRQKAQQLGPALDAIRRRFGEHAIAVATGDPEKATPTTRKKHGE